VGRRIVEGRWIMKEEWFKVLEELTSPCQAAHLEDRIHEEILVKAEQFTQEKAAEFVSGTELFAKLMIAYAGYTEKHGPFGDMFGSFLTETRQLGKAGQFFTPMHIVDAMVRISIGDKPSEKPQVILDPAAGSGRFMLGTAKHYMNVAKQLNFIFFNVDIDFRAYVYCAMNAILNGIPAITVWGDSLAMHYREGIVTIPMGKIAWWRLLDSEEITALMNRHTKGEPQATGPQEVASTPVPHLTQADQLHLFDFGESVRQP
jgi:type I restriction-modification system DNA methylase subunit